MTNLRNLAHLAPMLLLLAPVVFPHSAVASALRYLGIIYITIDLVLKTREGYLRRRPHWTRESWRGYLKLCLVPAGALLIMMGMTAAIELRLPVVGAARSTLRMLWVLGTVAFMVVFAVGLVMVIERLTDGEPSRPFEWPKWLGGKAGT